MPRPSKRAIASRSAAAVSAVKRQRTRTRNNATGELGVHDSRSSEEASRSFEEEESDDDEVELSDAEDLMLPVMQPESGWADAERKCYGYSKTNAGKSPQSKWYYNKKKKELEHEKEVAQKTYGSISRYFASMSPSPLPVRESEDSAIEEAGDFLHLQPVSETNDGLLPTEVFRTTALDFEGTFFRSDAFEQEIEELDLWLKRSNLKAQVAGDWLKRVTGVRDLLRFQGSWIYLKEDNPTLRKRRWIEYSEVIAVRLEKGPKYAQFLRKWQRDWFDLRIPPPCPMKGKHVKRRSLYNDEGVMLAVREYLNNAMWRANTQGICEAVKVYLQSQRAYDVMKIDVLLHKDSSKTEISERTAQRWFLKLGWVYGRNKKGYCDGHERKDVVEYRDSVFCPRMKEIFKTLREYDDSGQIFKSVPIFSKRRHLVTHDESTFNANDGSSYSWKKGGSEWLKPKSRGKGIMISDFLCAAIGRLSYYDNTEGKRVYATEIIKYGSGKSDEGWWNAEKMVEQTRKAIDIFNTAFPNDIAVFAFDNSSGHACKAPDALNAYRMNLNPGGKQPLMHDTAFYRLDGSLQLQYMSFQPFDSEWDTDELIPAELIGKPKGIKRVLQERGLWIPGLKKQCGRQKKDKNTYFGDRLFEETMEEYDARVSDRCEAGKSCCALRTLEAQQDFREEKSMLEHIITAAGHEIIFYPKFHCELNYIEYYWASLKKFTRENCKYSFVELEKTVLQAMDSVSLKTIRRFADRSKRWMMAYINGLTEEQRSYAEKQYKSHRRATRDVFV